MELVARKRGTPVRDVLRGLYDADPDLRFLPHAATQDFKNRRATALRREERFLHVPALEDTPEEPSESGVILQSERPDERPDENTVSWKSAEELARRIRRLFRHTKVESRILTTLVTLEKLDPRDSGFVQDLAQAAGCDRKTVRRYLDKVKAASKGSFLQSF
jgi:hypothetical protein